MTSDTAYARCRRCEKHPVDGNPLSNVCASCADDLASWGWLSANPPVSPVEQNGFVSIDVAQFALLTTKVGALEALAKRVVREGHARWCFKELHKGEGCCCFVAEAMDALGVDHAG